MKTTGSNGFYEAVWNGTEYVATLEGGETWTSDDGNTWMHPDGSLPDSLEFGCANIHLINGPRNGDTVD